MAPRTAHPATSHLPLFLPPPTTTPPPPPKKKTPNKQVAELELMLATRVKAEIQALSSFGFQYLTQVWARARAVTLFGGLEGLGGGFGGWEGFLGIWRVWGWGFTG